SRAALEDELRHDPEGLDRRTDEHRRDARLLPRVELVADLLLRTDEADLLDHLRRHRGDRVVLLTVEEQLLDLAGLRLVAEPAEDVVVEVHAPSTHAADV